MSAPMVETQDQACLLCGCADSEVMCSTYDFCYETCANEFHYARCKTCGHVYLKNRPVLAALDTIYPQNYLTFEYKTHLGKFINALRNQVQKAKTKAVARFAQPGDSVIDVGCGGGDYLRLLKAFGDPSWALYGVDFSDKAGEVLKKSDIAFIKTRFEEMEWAGNPVGVIVMNQLIEHVEDPGASARKACEILRPGGVLIMETPNLNAWDARLFRNKYWGCWHAPRHWNVFTPQTLTHCVEQAGLKVETVEYTLNPFAWLHSIQYLLRDRYGLRKLGRLFDVDVFPSLAAASMMDVIQKLCTGQTSNMRFIARKP